LKIKKLAGYSIIYRDFVGFDASAASACVDFLKNNPDCAVVAPLVKNKSGQLLHNYRNFPTLIDFVIKNISWLRQRFSSRMRRFLMWDIRMDKASAVDFVTTDFMCVRPELLENFGVDRTTEDFFDLKLCLTAWSQKWQVMFVPSIEVHSKLARPSRSILGKLTLLLSAIAMKLRYARLFTCSKYPSKEYDCKKEMLMNAHKVNSRSFLRNVGSRFQKRNTVVQVYEGQIEGNASYKQPLVFHYDGVLAVLKNKQNAYGLINIWRHAPIKANVPNLFPVFPDTQDLGIYSYECVRGGAEKSDSRMEQSVLRELKEEINLDAKEILNIRKGSRLVSNTAWDVSNVYVFIVTIDNVAKLKLQQSESIVGFDFYSQKQILEMIQQNQIVCALTRAALLEDILAHD